MKDVTRHGERIAIIDALCALIEKLEDHAASFNLEMSAEEAANLWLTVDSAQRRIASVMSEQVAPKLSQYVEEHGAIPLGLDNLCLTQESMSEEVALDGAEEGILRIVLDKAAEEVAQVLASMLRKRKEGAFLPTQVEEVLNARDVFYQRIEKTRFTKKKATRNIVVLNKDFLPKRKAKSEEGAA